MSLLRLPVRGPARHALLRFGTRPRAVVIARRPCHHVLVFLDAVRGYQRAAVDVWVLLGGGPGKEVSADLNVVVRC